MDVLCERFHDAYLIHEQWIRELMKIEGSTTESPYSLQMAINPIQFIMDQKPYLHMSNAEQWETTIIHMVVSKLAQSTRRAWLLFLKEKKQMTLENLLQCLTREQQRIIK